MLIQYLARPELRQHLCSKGHNFSETAREADNVDVSPPPDIGITVAVEPDAILYPEYRNRYFAFRAECTDEPLLPCDRYFPLPEAFKLAAKRDPPAGDLMAGPVRWLIHRLVRFPRILLWPMSSSLIYTADGWLPEVFGRVPRLRPLHPKACLYGEAAGAIILNQGDPADAQVLWSVANHVSQLGDDYFVSDLDGAEVYMLHHHDNVVISIPDQHRRSHLLDELAGWSDVLMDCSGYTSATDNDPEIWA
jgi:hypothetical protein